MEKILEKKSLSRWVKKLDAYQVYAPAKDGDVWNYALIEKPEDLLLDHTNTVLSPKAIVFPQTEILLEFNTSNENELRLNESLPQQQPTIIFGVRPCDAKAITLTDKVFGGDFVDPYYWKRRNQTLLIGLTCNTPPSPNCFCLSVGGSPHYHDGLDILMTDMGDRYFVESLTEKGDKLLNLGKSLFAKPTAKDKKELAKIQANSEKNLKRQLKSAKKISSVLKEMFESSYWDQESMSCLRCGICTYLCPTCHCFDMNDEVAVTSPIKGKRVRTWDTCQFPDFTMHSSGHNPRPDKASRLRQRVFHKFYYFPEWYKEFQCIGCGRCISKCPVGIDIIQVLDGASDHGS
jgi:ferredoxin